MQLIWKDTHFLIKPYKEQYIILKDLDELQETLDTCLTDMNTILGSRFITTYEPLKIDAENQMHQLTLFSEIFELWKEVQRNWMYLENIFQSQDIQRECQSDYIAFMKVNTFWNDKMKAVDKNNNCQRHNSSKFKKEFIANNEKMEDIKVQLEKFLETKRNSFPRFYFLSNDELLQILAAATDILAVEKHLAKIF